ncbi:hypothetical protein FOXYS1_12120 [Fusarium oxysporum]|uniref:Heterokaryon incompatibility domain-containing protein n=1 Tax=Fusarium oxysporum TaxID=5507 RepID=A0A8H5A1Y0_FUSOX|nr:hypothetical protein FOXYS1_12120 [Fusarium oxysporum]
MVLSKQTTEERLCSRCESLDLDNIPSGRWTNVECREPVAFFGKRSAVLHDEGCPLCQAPFYIAAGEHNTWSCRREDKFCMFAIPSQLAYRGAKLEFTSDGEMASSLIDPANVDFEAVKRWLAHCAGVHGELCNPGEGKRPLPKGLAVINCTTRKLEPLPTGVKFAALSYVWETECPEKREQIQKMHKIYREADLTIIAAAGDGPDYGLPGISTPRVSAPSVDLRLGAHRLVSTGRSDKKLSETRDGRLELGHFKRALFQEGSSSSLYGA